METITVQIKNKKAHNFLRDLEDIDMIKVLKEITPKSTLKQKIKKDLQEGFHAISLHEKGKIKLKTLDELIHEI